MTNTTHIQDIIQHDTAEDAERLHFFFQDLGKRIEILKKRNVPQSAIQLSIEEYNKLQTLLKQCKTLETETYSSILFTIEKHIRYCYSILAAFMVSEDWQSPSFLQSKHSQAGSEEGSIIQSYNDYKRDQHQYAHQYEKIFRQEYIRSPLLSTTHIYATNSGMAALTTIAGFLKGEFLKPNDGIAVGSQSYFENKKVLSTLFSEVYECDETNLSSVQQCIQVHRPPVWFIDSQANNKTLGVHNIERLFALFSQQQKYNPIVVIDNTLSPLFVQPFIYKHRPSNLLCWESLLKYHQYGLDRVNGGVIYSQCKHDQELYTYRDHLGTIMSDYTACALPTPNKNILTKRLLRHQRNTHYVAEKLADWLQKHPHSPISNVIYPGFFTSKHTNMFAGSHIVIDIKKTRRPIVYIYKKLLKHTIQIAKERNLQIVGGTSFGFTSTRLYIPASRPGQGEPFFRISIGTERINELETLTEVLKKAFETI